MRVSALNVYPVKSFRGGAVDQARVARRGLAGDRRWMVVDAGGRFMTQREHPEMTGVRARLEGDTLVLRHPRAGELRLPAELGEGPRRAVEVWSSRVEAIEHAEGSAFVRQALGGERSLVFMPDDVERGVNPQRGRPGDIVGFADAYPMLMISEASLVELNARIAPGAPISMERFRPNLVIEGCGPFDEDRWPGIRIGELTFHNAKLCDRCVLTTVDPESGAKGPEPLRTLATFRAWDGAVWFGVNLIPDGVGALRVGDRVEPLA